MVFAISTGMIDVDAYAILALKPGFTRKELEESFHRLMTQRPPLDIRERSLVEWAYLILSDAARKAAYDRSRGMCLHPGLTAGSSIRARNWFETGRRAMGAGRWREASRAFRLAVAGRPWEAQYRSHLALSMAHLGQDLHRARELCLEALRLEPDNDICRKHLAAVYEKAGLVKRARRVLHHSGS